MPEHIFVERSCEQVYQQPFEALEVKFYGFVLEADGKLMKERICDRYLNEPSNGATDFRPVGPWVMLVFAKLSTLHSTEPPYSDMGCFTENEAAFWLLTVDFKNIKRGLHWVHPYMMVDNPYCFGMGRELYGFPKSWGEFTIPKWLITARKFSAHAKVFKEYNKSAELCDEEVLAARRVRCLRSKTANAKHHGLYHMVQELVPGITKGPLGRSRVELDPKGIGNALISLPMVFLKQFRDVQSRKLACYQSIVEVGANLRSRPLPLAWLLPGEYEVKINSFPSHPFDKDMGFKENEKLRPLLSFWANFDFDMGNGKEIWRAD